MHFPHIPLLAVIKKRKKKLNGYTWVNLQTGSNKSSWSYMSMSRNLGELTKLVIQLTPKLTIASLVSSQFCSAKCQEHCFFFRSTTKATLKERTECHKPSRSSRRETKVPYYTCPISQNYFNNISPTIYLEVSGYGLAFHYPFFRFHQWSSAWACFQS